MKKGKSLSGPITDLGLTAGTMNPVDQTAGSGTSAQMKDFS